MAPKRKHVQLTAAEIKKSIDKNKLNSTILKELLHEITFRKKAQKTLAPYVIKAQKWLDELSSSETLQNEEPLSSIKSPVNNANLQSAYENAEPTVVPPKTVSTESPAQPQAKHSRLVDQQSITSTNGDDKPANKNGQQYSRLLGKLGFIREASPSLKGLPQAWSLTPEDTFEVKGLAQAKSNSEKFRCALSGLIWEIRKGARFSKTVHLVDGRKQDNISGEYGHIYSFVYTSDEEFFEGATIDVKAGGKSTKGSIVSMLPGTPARIIISLEEDFGASIAACSITQDEAALLEALQDRFEVELGLNTKKLSPVGMNEQLSDMLLCGKSERLNPEEQVEVDVSFLNSGQSRFVEKALGHSISFLWGPPGTGKTQALGALAAHFFKSDERTLVCSNTNQAVDQVLLKLCREMKQQGRLKELEDGKIVRVGRISQSELSDEFSTYVTVDGIAARKSAELTNKIEKLEVLFSRHDVAIQKLNTVLDAFERLSSLEKQQSNATEKLSDSQHRVDSTLELKTAVNKKLKQLDLEKERYAEKGFFSKAFSRGVELIDADTQFNQAKLTRADQSVEQLTREISELKLAIEKYPSDIAATKKITEAHNFSQTKSTFDAEQKRLSDITSELSILKKQIEEMRKTILSQATMIGATLTKSFLSPSELGKFCNVIIDEASMGLLPAVYFTSSQSNRRCIISGDFRQLPPIVQSKNKTILDLIGMDIFSYSGMEDTFLSKTETPYSDVLSEQYRMDPMICGLISNIGYEGNLFTSENRKAKELAIPEMFTHPVTIIDTSAIYPFTDRDPFGSTSNLLHALISRNIMRLFDDIEGGGTIGYCAPFKAQIKLLKKISENEPYGSRASIGTVHTFQGDEKDTIIFDTVSSLGEKHYLNPTMAQETASKSNLLTVAISRAQSQLVFIANLRYLDQKIPAMGYLRKLLYNAQVNGNVIDARDIVDLTTFEKEANKTEFDYGEAGIDLNDLNTGLIDETKCFPLLKQDLQRAKKYIVIYSGFYTAARIGDLLPILIEKIRSGVKIRIIIPPPNRNGTINQSDSEMVTEKLMSHGILVEFRSKIHQKAVLIDTDIVWFGSLNPLSFSGKTEETMLRINQDNITGTFAANMAINRNSAKEDPALMVEPELPACSFCGGKVTFNRGKYGAYVTCLSCDKNQTLKGF